jgi:hypothetical protein
MTYTGTVYHPKQHDICWDSVSSKTTWHILGQYLYYPKLHSVYWDSVCLYHPKQHDTYWGSVYLYNPKQRDLYRGSVYSTQTWYFVLWLCLSEVASCFSCSVRHHSSYWTVAVEHFQHLVPLFGSLLSQTNNGVNLRESQHRSHSMCLWLQKLHKVSFFSR